jgi:hypothetical protein
LPVLDEYIAAVAKRDKSERGSNTFQPGSNIVKYKARELPTYLVFSDPEYKAYNLAAFEDWIASNLDLWLEDHLGDMDTCGQLGQLMKVYYEIALPFYSGTLRLFQ